VIVTTTRNQRRPPPPPARPPPLRGALRAGADERLAAPRWLAARAELPLELDPLKADPRDPEFVVERFAAAGALRLAAPAPPAPARFAVPAEARFPAFPAPAPARSAVET